jgi:coenzyme F420-0:L-glutamate ligase / coenzyme F420-1:gamma-L-glutamate ligase
MMAQIQGFLVRGLPVIREGDDLASLIESLFKLQNGDILCIASTVVAKSEGALGNSRITNLVPGQ